MQIFEVCYSNWEHATSVLILVPYCGAGRPIFYASAQIEKGPRPSHQLTGRTIRVRPYVVRVGNGTNDSAKRSCRSTSCVIVRFHGRLPYLDPFLRLPIFSFISMLSCKKSFVTRIPENIHPPWTTPPSTQSSPLLYHPPSPRSLITLLNLIPGNKELLNLYSISLYLIKSFLWPLLACCLGCAFQYKVINTINRPGFSGINCKHETNEPLQMNPTPATSTTNQPTHLRPCSAIILIYHAIILRWRRQFIHGHGL